MKVRKTNPMLLNTLKALRKASRESRSRLWKTVAERLKAPKSFRARVNLSTVNRHSENGETIVVPGKVLGAGKVDHRLTVAALGFTREAKRKIEASGGRCLPITMLVQQNPMGLNVKLIG